MDKLKIICITIIAIGIFLFMGWSLYLSHLERIEQIKYKSVEV